MEQNIFLALAFAVLAGICNTLSAVVLVVQDEKTKNSRTSGKTAKYVGLALNLLMQGMATTFGTVSSWFGPASLYAPTSLSAQLLSNILIIGYIMKRENVNKETQVATAVILISALILPCVGPRAQDEEDDILHILQQPGSVITFALLFGVLIVSAFCMIFKDLEQTNQSRAEACLMAVAASSGVLTPSISRAFSIVEAGPFRISLIVLYVLIMLIWTRQCIVEARIVKTRTRYVPTYLCSTLIFNAVAGLLIWEDWRSVVPLPYACVLFQMMLGVYLMSDLNHFEVVSKQTRSALQRQASTVRRDLNAGISSLPELFDTSFHGNLPHFHVRQTKVSFVDEELTRGVHLSNIAKEGSTSNDSFKGRQLRHSLSMRSIQISKSAATVEEWENEHGIVDEEEAAIPKDSCRHSFVY